MRCLQIRVSGDRLAMLLALAACICGLASAETLSGGDYAITSSTLTPGTASASADEQLTARAAIGESANPSTLAGGDFRLRSGFLAEPPSEVIFDNGFEGGAP